MKTFKQKIKNLLIKCRKHNNLVMRCEPGIYTQEQFLEDVVKIHKEDFACNKNKSFREEYPKQSEKSLSIVIIDKEANKRISPNTQEYYNLMHKLGMEYQLCYPDMEDFAITSSGNLILLDEVGGVSYVDPNKYTYEVHPFN